MTNIFYVAPSSNSGNPRPEDFDNKIVAYPHELFLRNAICNGSIGAVVSALLTYPIYRKDRLQIDEKVLRPHRFKPICEIAVGGFFKLGLQGLLYDYLVVTTRADKEQSETKAFWKNLGCSLLAGAGSAPVINFYEQAALIKGENQQFLTSKEVWFKLCKEKRMMRGLAATAARDAIFVCAYARLAPFFSQMLINRLEEGDKRDKRISFACMAIGASAAGAFGGVLQTPADVLRAQRHKSTNKVVSYWQSAKSIRLQTWTSTILLKASIGARAVPMIFLLQSPWQSR